MARHRPLALPSEAVKESLNPGTSLPITSGLKLGRHRFGDFFLRRRRNPVPWNCYRRIIGNMTANQSCSMSEWTAFAGERDGSERKNRRNSHKLMSNISFNNPIVYQTVKYYVSVI